MPFTYKGKPMRNVSQNVIDTTVLLDKLGLVVHPEKSTLIPTQVLTILGFVINSVAMTIQLTREKATSLQNVCTELLANPSPSIREVASVIGKIVSSFPGVMHGAFYYDTWKKINPKPFWDQRVILMTPCLCPLMLSLNYIGGFNMWEMRTM